MAKRPPTASLTLNRPAEPITTSAMLAALQPLLDLIGVTDVDDVRSLTVTPNVVRVQLIPRTRGRAQHDSQLRVTYPIVWDEDSQQ